MERVKLLMPQKFKFSTHLTIRITDLNYGGHVGNDKILSIVHEARQQFLFHYGYSELDFAGTSLIMADAAIEFKKELYYKDNIKISVCASNFDKLGFDLYYLLEVEKEGQWQMAGKVKTGMMCFDYGLNKKTSVPESAIKKLAQIDDSPN